MIHLSGPSTLQPSGSAPTMVANDGHGSSLLIARIVCRIEVHGVCRTKSCDVDHNRLCPCQGEMRHATGLGVEAARRQRLCGGSVSHAAIAEVPGARHHDGRTIIAMRVRLDYSVGRNAEATGVDPWFRRITQRYGRVNSSHMRSACASADGFLGCNLSLRQAILTRGRA